MTGFPGLIVYGNDEFVDVGMRSAWRCSTHTSRSMPSRSLVKGSRKESNLEKS